MNEERTRSGELRIWAMARHSQTSLYTRLQKPHTKGNREVHVHHLRVVSFFGSFRDQAALSAQVAALEDGLAWEKQPKRCSQFAQIVGGFVPVENTGASLISTSIHVAVRIESALTTSIRSSLLTSC
jgi:hypothetical protein